MRAARTASRCAASATTASASILATCLGSSVCSSRSTPTPRARVSASRSCAGSPRSTAARHGPNRTGSGTARGCTSRSRSLRTRLPMADRATRILLVEDNAAHAELVQRALEDMPSLQLQLARRLDDARSWLQRATPDLVIADLRLPDGEGIELCAGSNGAPVVIMTSQGSEADAVAAMRAGALDYVVKSEAMFEEMPHVVERALREWKLAQAHARADRSLHAQFEVASALATSSSLAQAAPRILEAICACVGWPMGEFWRVDERAGVL